MKICLSANESTIITVKILSYSRKLPSGMAVGLGNLRRETRERMELIMFENEFQGKVVLVTGGSRGIGFAAVKKFLAAGAKVCFLSRTEETGEKAMTALKEINPEYEVINRAIDLCDYKATQELYAELEEKWGGVDVLVNNAGVDCTTPVSKLKQSEWDSVMNTNLKALFNMSKYSVKYLKKSKGCIVNTASVAGVYGSGNGLPYPVSKAGVIGMTKSLAWELAYAGIRVNAVAPGVIATDMVAALPKFAKDSINNTIPLKRFGEPEDVADAILFLASSAASYITGVTIQVDGGYRPANTL